jgi:zinc transport system substrate-binding protein
MAVSLADNIKVLCTTFPVYQITRNVAQGRNRVDVQLMLSAQLGCPHDYVLTPQDMKKITAADVLIVNGLGLEEFLGAPTKRAKPGLKIVDSSSGIGDLLKYSDDDARAAEEERHGHSVMNPHLFASPRMAAKMAGAIAAGLAGADPGGAELYKQNADAYAARMNKLADELAALGKTLKNNRIVTQHGVFDYLASDAGIEVVAVLQEHAGQEPSAAEMIKLVKAVRSRKAGAICTEPQYASTVGQTIAAETGVPIVTLDPVATGPQDASLDYYEVVMRKNMETLKQTLGVRK